jgi:hypothetical protein
MDIAETRTGNQIVIELGDGGVSGWPSDIDPTSLYRGLGVEPSTAN